MHRFLLVMLVVAGCNHDRPEDKRAYELMTKQVNEWAAAAARGEDVRGFDVMAEGHCFQARRDQATIESARPLAKACDEFLPRIKAAAAKRTGPTFRQP